MIEANDLNGPVSGAAGRRPSAWMPSSYLRTIDVPFTHGPNLMLLLPIVILWWAKSPMRFASGRARHVICLTSLSAIALVAMTTSSMALADEQRNREDAAAVIRTGTPKSLREGTLVPATVGQIVMIGRRWAFIPQTVDATPADDIVRLGISSSGGELAPSREDFRSLFSPVMLVSTSDPTVASKPQPSTRTLILNENLALQRVVEALRADSSDDRWIISGEITEYFNENRMTIRTAQRSNSQ